MKKLAYLPLAFALFLNFPIFGYENFEKKADVYRSVELNVPEKQTFQMFERQSNGTFVSNVIERVITVRPDGSFVEEVNNPKYSSKQEFTRNGLLVFSQREAKPYTIVTKVTESHKKVQTIVLENGKEKSNKTTDIHNGIVLFQELSFALQQVLKSGVRDGIVIKSLSPDGGMIGDFEVKISQTSKPLQVTDKYEYPPEFKAAFSPSEDYIVADLALTGIGALFYPHHFLFVFKKSATGVDFYAYWGEEPQKATYQFRK